MIHLYTGEGKGKTTAAIGLSVRAAGRDFRVYFTQFMKGNDTGELHTLKKLPNVTLLRSEKNFGFYSSMSEENKAELTRIHNEILDRLTTAVENGDCDLIVMDELTYPVKWGLLDEDRLRRLLCLAGGLRHAETKENPGADSCGRSGDVELVITGRDAAEFLVEAADYVTEMKCVRHPYEKGIRARRGIEF